MCVDDEFIECIEMNQKSNENVLMMNLLNALKWVKN